MPPVPSDAAVALGAFLSHRGVTTSARGLPRHLGRQPARRRGRVLRGPPVRPPAVRLADGPAPARAPLARRSSSASTSGFGTVGIFISRFLPGIRAVVPPFAGLVGLGAVRTFVPMGLASAIWYGGITILGAVIGAEWDRITRAHRRRQPDARHRDAGRGRGRRRLVSAGAAGSAGASGCGTPPRTRSIPAAPSFLAGTEIAEGSARQAAALVVLELAYADPVLTPDDRTLIAEHLHEPLGPRSRRTPPSPAPEEERAHPVRRLRPPAPEARGPARSALELVERMWTVAFATAPSASTRTG